MVLRRATGSFWFNEFPRHARTNDFGKAPNPIEPDDGNAARHRFQGCLAKCFLQ